MKGQDSLLLSLLRLPKWLSIISLTSPESQPLMQESQEKKHYLSLVTMEIL